MELLVLPALLLLSAGLSFLFDGTDDTQTATSKDPTPPDEAPQSFLRLTDGDDQATGDAQDDVIFARAGDDQVAGGPGDDRIFLGDGDDQNFVTRDGVAELGIDTVAGDDLVRGGAGQDLIVDFLGANTLFGDTGQDILDGTDQGGSAQTGDTLFGGYGADLLAGDSGDTLFGGQGDDLFFVSLDAADPDVPVIADYEAGERLIISVPLAFQDSAVDLTLRDGGLDVMLDGHALVRLEGVTDPAIVDIALDAADFADQTVTPGKLSIGSDGDDTLVTGAGDDAIFAGRGDDNITSGDGDDYITLRGARPFEPEGELGWGTNTVDAGAGADRVLGGLSDDTIQGGDGNDLIDGGGGRDVIRGGSGADRIDAYDADAAGKDIILAGVGDDFVVANDGDVVTLGDGADTLVIESGGAAVVVTDFRPGLDRIALEGAEGQIKLVASGADTLINTGNQTQAVLRGLSPDQIMTGDIRRGA